MLFFSGIYMILYDVIIFQVPKTIVFHMSSPWKIPWPGPFGVMAVPTIPRPGTVKMAMDPMPGPPPGPPSPSRFAPLKRAPRAPRSPGSMACVNCRLINVITRLLWLLYIYSYIAYSKCYYSSCYSADYHNLRRRDQSIAKVPFETYVQTLEGKKAHRKTWPKGQKMSEARHMSWTDSWLIPKLSTNSCTSAAPTE